MWSQPGAKQTPEAFHGVDVYFVDTVSISVAGVLALTVIDRDMDIAPGRETGIDAVFVGIHRASLLDHFGDPGLNGGLLDIAAQPQETLPTTRDHAQHWWLVGGRCPTPPFPFTPSTPTYTPLFCTSACWPLCPATR
jgi:hypothetical protein